MKLLVLMAALILSLSQAQTTTKSRARLRAQPENGSDVAETVPEGTALNVIGMAEDPYLAVEYEGRTLYVHKGWINMTADVEAVLAESEAAERREEEQAQREDQAQAAEELAATFTGPPATAEGCEVSIAGFELERGENEVGRDIVRLLLSIENQSDRRVSAWKMDIVIENVFGDELVATDATDGSANILPGTKETSSFFYRDNPYIRDEGYDRLATYNAENLRIRIRSCQVAFN